MSTARAPWRNTNPAVQDTGPAALDAPIEMPPLACGAGQQGRYATRDPLESRQIAQQIVQRVQRERRLADDERIPEPRATHAADIVLAVMLVAGCAALAMGWWT